MLRRLLKAVAAYGLTLSTMMALVAAPALAQKLGQPSPGEIGLQPPATELMSDLIGVYDVVNVIIIGITLFVLALMLYVMYRFSEKNNPTPSRTTHNTFLEVAWTVIPIVILAGIAIPSFGLLYKQYDFPKPDVTIKAIGNAWFWEHEYVDHQFTVTSNMITDEDVLRKEMGDEAFDQKFATLEGAARSTALHADSVPIWEKTNQPRQLTVDNEIAVPVNKNVHLLVTANDVIHSWTIPAFGVKMQAVPGRTAALWFNANTKGTFHGQCSVLCGKLHSGMPITVRVVDQAVYDSWIEALKAKDRKKANEILKADAEAEKAKQNVAQVAN